MSMPRPEHAMRGVAAFVLLLGAVPALNLLPLEIGTTTINRHFGAFIALWAVLGLIGVTRLSSGWASVATTKNPLERLLSVGTDRAWVVGGVVAVFGLSVFLRVVVLHSVDLLDDDGAYLYSAQLLAAGQLWMDSPPMKLFFDRTFLVNDGHMYSQYFLGWPAMLVPGVWLGDVDWVNPFYASLTVPAVFKVAKRVARTPIHARLAVLLYATSPMVIIAAATLMSHTASVLLLAWATHCGLRALDDDGHAGHAALFGTLMAVTFFNRPLEVVGLMLPMGVVWLIASIRGRKVGQLAAFIVPVALLAWLFVWVIHVQNGDPFQTAYERYNEYRAQNDFRFTTVPAHNDISIRDPVSALGNLVIALFRLNLSLFGWPVSFVLLIFASRMRNKWLWWMFGSFVATRMLTQDPGSAIAGPTHVFDILLPVIWLSVDGWGCLTDTARESEAPDKMGRLVGALVLGSMLASALVSTPIRVHSLVRMRQIIERPALVVEEAGLSNAVVFASYRLMVNCGHERPEPLLRFARDVPNPQLSDDILWLNHLNAPADRRLMAKLFPDREGWVLTRGEGDCGFVLQPLDDPDALVPETQIPGLEELYLP